MEPKSKSGLSFFEVGQNYTEMYTQLDIYSLLLCLGICALTYESFVISPQPEYEEKKPQRRNLEFIQHTSLTKLNKLLSPLLYIL